MSIFLIMITLTFFLCVEIEFDTPRFTIITHTTHQLLVVHSSSYIDI